MEAKYGKIKQLLRGAGIEGAIVSSPENFHYLAGFAGHQHTVSRQPGMTFAVVNVAGSDVPCLATMDFELPAFDEKRTPLFEFDLKKYDTWVGVKEWSEITGETACHNAAERKASFDVLLETANEMGLANKTIGVELSYLPADYYQILRQKMPEAEFVNISEMFVRARSVKTHEETTLFRELCGVADEALTEVSKIAGIGVSEAELAHVFRRCVVESGFCLPSEWSMFSAGPNGARLGLPSDRKICAGDVIKFDGGVNAGFDFYTTDTSRSWITDGAPSLLHKLKDRLYEAQRLMIEAAKPGLPINELFNIGYSHVRTLFPAYRRGHMGHSISMGPATSEAPFIAPSETRALEPGMVLAVEAPCYIRGVGGFNIEDMVLITETGAEILTPKTPHYI